MKDIAAHIRIFDLNPSDDLVKKRTSAVRKLAARFAKLRTSLAIFQSANDLATAVQDGGELSDTLARQIETDLRQSASAFVADGQELQMTVCGLLAARHLLSTTDSGPDKPAKRGLAIGLWSALSFQTPCSRPKLEVLRCEVLQTAREVALETAQGTRQRSEVPAASIVAPEGYDPTELSKAFEKGMSRSIAALKANAEVDPEEIDLLWWVLVDWSELLGRRFSSTGTPEARALASGLEAGALLRRLPGDAHQHLVLRQVEDTDPMDLHTLLGALGDDLERLAKAHQQNGTVAGCPTVFPLLAALGSGSVSSPYAETSRSLREWASRALLESAALSVICRLPGVVD